MTSSISIRICVSPRKSQSFFGGSLTFTDIQQSYNLTFITAKAKIRVFPQHQAATPRKRGRYSSHFSPPPEGECFCAIATLSVLHHHYHSVFTLVSVCATQNTGRHNRFRHILQRLDGILGKCYNYNQTNTSVYYLGFRYYFGF